MALRFLSSILIYSKQSPRMNVQKHLKPMLSKKNLLFQGSVSCSSQSFVVHIGKEDLQFRILYNRGPVMKVEKPQISRNGHQHLYRSMKIWKNRVSTKSFQKPIGFFRAHKLCVTWNHFYIPPGIKKISEQQHLGFHHDPLGFRVELE